MYKMLYMKIIISVKLIKNKNYLEKILYNSILILLYNIMSIVALKRKSNALHHKTVSRGQFSLNCNIVIGQVQGLVVHPHIYLIQVKQDSMVLFLPATVAVVVNIQEHILTLVIVLITIQVLLNHLY